MASINPNTAVIILNVSGLKIFPVEIKIEQPFNFLYLARLGVKCSYQQQLKRDS